MSVAVIATPAGPAKRLTLVVQQLLPRLGGVLGIRALHNRVDWARLLAEAAVYALGHVDVVAGRAAGAVGTLLGLDGDGLGGADLDSLACQGEQHGSPRGTYGLAELAGDAAFLAGGITSQGVLSTETRRDGALEFKVSVPMLPTATPPA